MGHWIEIASFFESLPSSPSVRGLSFDLPGGMRGVGTSPSASPPSDNRGLSGRLAPPSFLAKCRKCGVAYNKTIGRCPECGKKEGEVGEGASPIRGRYARGRAKG